jgi:predicted lipoprotein with Yx(FWY)xxD motif
MKRLLVLALVPGMALALVVGASASVRSAKVATIQLKRVGKLGKVVVNGHGQTLYLFQKDKHGKSSCYGQCAKFWPPALTTGKPKAGAGVRSSKLGTTKRKNGKLQVTFNGHPLYAYAGDSRPGQANGQGSNNFGARWYVMNARGGTVTKR